MSFIHTHRLFFYCDIDTNHKFSQVFVQIIPMR